MILQKASATQHQKLSGMVGKILQKSTRDQLLSKTAAKCSQVPVIARFWIGDHSPMTE